ncbi:MAG: hypothetical protein FD173_2082 [Gallionellaceae bacterium]|nr:MAG: hypothetical protein FD173_2082 [Gallionellaceae bacterium]
MSTVTFDTLKFVETLKKSGFDDEKAKGIASAYQDANTDQEIVTKDILEMKLIEMKYDLLKWIIGLALGQFAILIGILMKLP